MVVVKLVVLDVPRLNEHPIQPVSAPARGGAGESRVLAPAKRGLQRADAKLEAVVLALAALVEATVADVVRDDRPARHAAKRQQ
eukprot:192125-Prymnesium_polylepis.1